MTFRAPLDLRTMASQRVTLDLAPHVDEHDWILLQPLVYAVGSLTAPEYVITVPAGFITDLASVPRWLWPLIPPHGAHASAAVVHDWLYRTGYTDRPTADRIFHEAMTVSDVPPLRARIMYTAVRLFGWRQSHRRRNAGPQIVTLPVGATDR